MLFEKSKFDVELNFFFGVNHMLCRFDNSNTEKLIESMCEEEKRQFEFDVGSIDWSDYIRNVHIPGLRRHVMKGRGTFS